MATPNIGNYRNKRYQLEGGGGGRGGGGGGVETKLVKSWLCQSDSLRIERKGNGEVVVLLSAPGPDPRNVRSGSISETEHQGEDAAEIQLQSGFRELKQD